MLITDTNNLPQKQKDESLTDYNERLTEWYIGKTSSQYRKAAGQYFTPKEVSELMFSQLDGLGQTPEITVLDPGAGTGIFESTFCERIISLGQKVRVSFDLYERDPNLLPLLELNMRACDKAMASKGFTFSYRIINEDFMVSNAALLNSEDEAGDARISRYNYVVCNPPFFKLGNSSPLRKTPGIAAYAPNVYAIFMALSAKLLRNNGRMVFITPRTYCSGWYFRRFRKWFFSVVKPTKIHLFESRRAVFRKYGVLQETMILTAVKTTRTPDKVTISVSNGHNGQDDRPKTRETSYDQVIVRKDEDVVVRISTSLLQELVTTYIDGFEHSLSALGFKASTGPVVPFRVRTSLLTKADGLEEYAPLIWMHNVSNGAVRWPLEKGGKPLGIKKTEDVSKMLLPCKNYVLVKRFSSKEGKQRVSAGVFLGASIDSDFIGIENHVNYLYKKEGDLTEDEALGIASLLNSRLYNRYFQAMNGSTQINATELGRLPFPSLDTIRKVGKLVNDLAVNDNAAREHLVIRVIKAAQRGRVHHF